MSDKKQKNRGSTVVEATLVMPLFIFAMLVLYNILVAKMVENEIYKAGVKTAEYIAEMGYLNDTGIVLPEAYFSQYIDDDRIEKYVDGGIRGIGFLGSDFVGKDDYFLLRLNYTIDVSVPFFPDLSCKKAVNIRQRYYRGGSSADTENSDEDEKYVYVTDNREAYHSTRLCTHLNLSTTLVGIMEAENMGYSPCEYCGDDCKEIVIITKEGKRYHSNGACTGLKRTIYRVKLSEIGGVKKCGRCTD